jgi:hypothetical protein
MTTKYSSKKTHVFKERASASDAKTKSSRKDLNSIIVYFKLLEVVKSETKGKDVLKRKSFVKKEIKPIKP